jgi:hypothetical protein
MSHKCNFCEKVLSSLSSLNLHQKTTKSCLLKQGKKKYEFICEFCDKICTTKYNLSCHILSCKEIKNANAIELLEKDQNKDKQIKLLEKELKLLEKDVIKKDSIIDKLEFIREKNQESMIKQEEQIKDLQNQIQKLAMRAIDKPTTHNSITNKLELTTFITPENIRDKIQRKFNDNYVSNGLKDVAKFVYEWILTTEDGNLIYACYDRSRLIFKYKDGIGNEVRDPKASQLGNMLKPELIKKLTEMLKYFTEEFEYINSRKERELDFDIKEYDTFKFLKENALELGFELTSMTDNNTFCNELANLIY